MKNRSILLTLLATFVVLSACDKETDNLSRPTYYPVFTLGGDEVMYITPGDAYVEEGATAEEEGAQIETSVSYAGTYFSGNLSTVDTETADKYVVTYSAINKDGFPGTKDRIVYVVNQGDLVNSIEGLYTSTVVRSPEAAPTFDGQYVDMEYVIIGKSGENTYTLSDIIGGYYDLPTGRAYGATYAGSTAEITANDISSDDFTFGPPIGVGVFGGEAEIKSIDVNKTAKTITIVSEWIADEATTYNFTITLKQVQL